MIKLILFTINLIISSTYAESRIKIALIDSGIYIKQVDSKYACKLLPGNVTDDKHPYSNLPHGPILFDIISSYINPKTHCIHSIKVFTQGGLTNPLEWAIKGLKIALMANYKYVNLSFSGRGYSQEEKGLLRDLSKKAFISIAAGNDKLVLKKGSCYIYPACYGYGYVVGSGDNYKSNRGEAVNEMIIAKHTDMGSSMAAAHKLGRMVKKE